MAAEPGMLGIAFDMWRAQNEGAAGQLRRQKTRLADLVEYARANSPYYRRLYHGLPTDGVCLEDLPPVAKPELMDVFEDWMTDPRVTRAGVEAFVADETLIGTPYCGEFFVWTSSGTTGHPGLFVHDRRAVAAYQAISLARIDRAWFGPTDWLAFARRGLRWSAIVGTGRHYAGATWMEMERRRSAWRRRAYRVFSVQRPLAETVAALNAFDPGVLTSYPSVLELLAEEQDAGRLRVRPVLLEASGESLIPSVRERIESAFDCRLYDAYAASEFFPMAFGCRHGWLHLNSDWAILEPVNEALAPTPTGEPSRSVLLTNLANRIQPIIRYDLGDSVLLRPDACPCGIDLPAIRVAGRSDDVLRLSAADGREISIPPLAIASVFDDVTGVHRGQLVQTGPSTVRVRIEPRAGVDAERGWRLVATSLRRYLDDHGLANVDVLLASEPPQEGGVSGKFRQVIGMPPTSPR